MGFLKNFPGYPLIPNRDQTDVLAIVEWEKSREVVVGCFHIWGDFMLIQNLPLDLPALTLLPLPCSALNLFRPSHFTHLASLFALLEYLAKQPHIPYSISSAGWNQTTVPTYSTVRSSSPVMTMSSYESSHESGDSTIVRPVLYRRRIT